MSDTTDSGHGSERVPSTREPMLGREIECFQYHPQVNIGYEGWVQMTLPKLFNAAGKGPQERYPLFATKRISWQSMDQGLAVQLCQQLYNEYFNTFEALERGKEEKKRLEEQILASENAQKREERFLQGYQECVSSTSLQLSEAAQLGTVLHNVINNIHLQLAEIGGVLRAAGGAGEVVAPTGSPDNLVAPIAPQDDQNVALQYQTQDEINRYIPEIVCEMIVHGVAVANGTLYLLLLDTPFGSLVDKHGVPCETGLYLLHKNLTKCLQDILPPSLALKDLSQWLGTGESFTLEARGLDTIRFVAQKDSSTPLAAECKRVARYRANNGISFISLQSLDRIVDGLKAKVGSSKVRDRQQCVDALDDFREHVKGEATCLHEHLQHIQEEQ